MQVSSQWWRNKYPSVVQDSAHCDATQASRYDNKEVGATTLARLITDCYGKCLVAWWMFRLTEKLRFPKNRCDFCFELVFPFVRKTKLQRKLVPFTKLLCHLSKQKITECVFKNVCCRYFYVLISNIKIRNYNII